MVKFYFTADTHFGHHNIIEYTNRPFKSVEHMDMELNRRWNERVTDEDIVYHLGDFAFRKIMRVQDYLDQLNGEVIIIRGNHDQSNDIKSKLTSAVIRHGGFDIWMSHEPKAIYKFNFCGHVHTNWRIHKTHNVIVNCGVDVWNFQPINFEEIMEAINKAPTGYSM